MGLKKINHKIPITFSFILLIIGIVAAWFTPVTGYEPDIYASTPIIFWIGIFFSYFISTVIILLSSKKNNTIPNYVTKTGIILIILTSLTLATLCLIRGYFGIDITGDVGSHIGELNTILNTGLISSYYPNIYLGPGAFALLTGNTVLSTINIYPIFYLGIYLLGVFLLTREIFPNKKIVILTTIVALYLPFGSAPYISGYEHVLFVGMQSTIRLIPILLYLVIKTCKTHSKPLFVATGVLCVSLVFYHPMASLLVLFLFTAVIIFNVLNKIIHKGWELYDIKFSVLMILTVGALFFLWSWKQFGPAIARGILSILVLSESDLTGSNAGELLSFASIAMGYGFDVLTILKMGTINLFIYACLVIGGLYYLLKCFKQNKGQYFGYIYTFIGLLGIATLAFMVMDIGFKYSRFLDEIYLGGIISAGLVLYLVLKGLSRHFSKHKVVLFCISICILIGVCGSSIVTIYPSPMSMDIGYQSTQLEFTGAETILPYINYEKNTTGIQMTGLQRYAHAIYGVANTVGNNYGDNQYLISSSKIFSEYAEQVPYHFGYDTGIDSLNCLYESGDTIFITETDKEYYKTYYPILMWDRWSPNDFEHLTMDKGLAYIYNNGEFTMYLVR